MEEGQGDILEATCGLMKGNLHTKLFLCPGIHERCIEVNGEMITPKMFCVMGEKARLKDWKTAIRVSNVSIRKQMETGQLDFYDHARNCTGKCMSRVGNINKLELANFLETQGLPTMVALPSNPPLSVATSLAGYVPSVLPTSQPLFPSVSPLFMQQRNVPNQAAIVSKAYTTNAGSYLMVKAESPEQDEYNHGIKAETDNTDIQHETLDFNEYPDTDSLIEDSQMFWTGIVGLGLLDEIFREIKVTVDHLKSDIIKNGCKTEDAVKASKIVHELNMATKLKYKLAAHKMDADKQNRKISCEVEVLKQKLREQEQKQMCLKRKSEYFDQLLIDLSKTKRARSSTPPQVSSDQPGVAKDFTSLHGNNMKKSATLPHMSHEGLHSASAMQVDSETEREVTSASPSSLQSGD